MEFMRNVKGFKFLCFLLLIVLMPSGIVAQKPYAVKAMVYTGKVLEMSKNLQNISPNMLLGGEIDFEFLPTGRYDWEQHWGFPTIGVGVVMIDLGTSNIYPNKPFRTPEQQVLGQAIALYPYVLVPIVYQDHFRLHYKVGAGLSFFNKRWNSCDTLSGVSVPTANSTIGSVLNCYLSMGMNIEVPIAKGFGLTIEGGYNHMSNGSMLQPNGGLNILYAEAGLRYELCGEPSTLPHRGFQPITDRLGVNLMLSGGARELYYADHKQYPIASVHIGATYKLSNFYALGGGFDMFYDGAFVQQGRRDGDNFSQHTRYGRYYIPNEDVANKFRVGMCISNEFLLGRLTAVLDWGIYLYDPLRNANPEAHTKYGYHRPMFYRYDIEKEDGWNYFRLGLRCRVWQGLQVGCAIKTHLQKAEMLEFGIGYRFGVPTERHSRL